MKRFFKSSYMALIIMLIYIPIFVFILLSFNSSNSMNVFQNFSFKWYKALANNSPFLQSIIVSIFVAVVSTIISLIIGVFAAIGISKSKRITQKMTLSITNIPIINADLLTAIGLMVMFLAFGIKFGIITLILAHISFNIPFVILTVLPRLSKIDQNLIKASLDLGSKPSQTLRKIILPSLLTSIITAAAICFAMSFDDFIISYFNSGSQNNVSVFIYSMKRMTPVINAFGTICIVLVTFVVVSYNLLTFYKKQYVKMRKDILKGVYKDSLAFKYEYKLNKYYYYLNHKNEIINTFYYKIYNFYYKIHCKIFKKEFDKNIYFKKQYKICYKKILLYEKKYSNLIKWVKNKKIKFIQQLNKKEEQANLSRNKWNWLNKSWRPIFLITIAVSSFALLTAFYIKTNNYDLSIANWDEYIDINLIKKFEQKYNVNVKYNVYDSNEYLYTKMYTTNYDIVFPSDYMVQKLAEEHRLAPIDYKALNTDPNYHIYKPLTLSEYNTINPKISDTPNKWVDSKYESTNYPKYYNELLNNTDDFNNPNKTAFLYPALRKMWTENQWQDNNKKYDISDYCLPYLWGDIKLVFNLKPEVESWLKQNNIDVQTSTTSMLKEPNHFNTTIKDPTKLSWDILQKAANTKINGRSMKILLNMDYRNLFMLACQSVPTIQREYPTTKKEADQAAAWLKKLVDHKNVYLMTTDLINTASDGNFDVAVTYNGDAILSDQNHYNLIHGKNPNQPSKEYLMTIPRAPKKDAQGLTLPEGTNIYSDNVSITKNAKNKPLAYKFLNFLIQNMQNNVDFTSNTPGYSELINSNVGYYNKTKNNAPFIDYAKNFIPVSKQYTSNPIKYRSEPEKSDKIFLLSKSIDKYMLDLYNKIISSKN